MRVLMSAVLTALLVGGCGAGQQAGGTTAGGTTPGDPAARQQAVDEVIRLAIQHCDDGIHGELGHVATEGPLLIVGTAGEVIEGRPSLDEVNQSYTTRNVVVRHDCHEIQRMAYASQGANVVWVEEALRTHAAWPGFSVNFPSQRTMIFERLPEGWRLRYYSLSVRLPDDQLDEAYAATDGTAAAPAAAPEGGDAAVAAPTQGDGQ